MNLKFLLILSILLISISGCIQSSLIEGFTFNSGKGTCTSRENSTAEITMTDNKINFSGYVISPDPCYELKASYSIKKVEFAKAPTTDVITVTITKLGSNLAVVCIQCIGEIPFNGEIIVNKDMWNSGNYGIEIVYEGKELTRLYNYVV
jgi:hypothetical protein